MFYFMNYLVQILIVKYLQSALPKEVKASSEDDRQQK